MIKCTLILSRKIPYDILKVPYNHREFSNNVAGGEKMVDFTVEQFNLIFKNSTDYVFLMKKVEDNYRYLAVSNSVVQLFGQDPVGRVLTDILDPAAARFMLPHYNNAIATNSQVTYQDYNRFKMTQKFETMLYPIHQQHQDFVLAFTKPLRYERELADYYLFTRSLLFNSYLSTIMLSTDGVVYEYSSKALADIGLDVQQLQGKYFFDLPMLQQEAIETLQYNIQALKNGEAVSPFFMKMSFQEHDEKYFLVSMNMILDRQNIEGIFLLLQDVTNYYLQTEKLRLTARDLANVQQALDSTAEIVITDIMGNIIEVNAPFCVATKYKRQELLYKPISILNSRTHSKSYFGELWATVLDGKIWRGEICNRTKYGEPYWVDTTIIPLKNEQQEINEFMCINLNISEKKAIMTELRNVDRIFRMITENTSDLIAITNEDGLLQYVSPAYSKLLQYTQDELQGTFYASILSGDSKDAWNDELYSKLSKEGEYFFEFEVQGRTGEVYLIESNIAVVHDSMRPNVSQIMMVSREITERKQKETELIYMAYHDSLTSLPNRRYLIQEFATYKKNALQYNESFAVIYLDGDNFKAVNDDFGHDVGDSFLREFGLALHQSVRIHDTVVRLGGDEFAIILPGLARDKNIRKEQVNNVIRDIHKRLLQGWYIESQHFAPTSSMGISFFPEDGMEMKRLLDAADEALLQAKSQGKNVFAFHEELKSLM